LKPSLFITFQRRDFSGPFLPSVSLSPDRLSWSAFGGPDQAFISAQGQLDNLLELTSTLRFPVQIHDHQNTPVWWGFVDEVIIFLEHVQVKVSLSQLYNKVSVQYSFISPDNKLADQLETTTVSNPQSQSEFGIKETVIHEIDLDEDIANALRDTFLSAHAWPFSELSQRTKSGEVYAQLHCSGWFKTLAWRNYKNLEGFYANYGPGPGIFAFGDAITHRYVGQSFLPGANVNLKYVYFRLRAEASPTTSLTARLHAQSSGYPGSVLATSSGVPASQVNGSKYSWIRFTFSSAVALSAGTVYWITLNPGGVDPNNYFYIKTDENMTFSQLWRHGVYYNETAGAWYVLPSETAPGTAPDLVFRFVCLSDTGSQISNMASSGNQFFEKIIGLTTGIQTSPYRNNENNCLEEIQSLMKVGTSNKRWVLATVTPARFLKFYEQPDPEEADIYIDSKSLLFTKHQVQLPSYFPPVGRFARLAATTRVSLPWDRNRIPACFIESAEYFPATDTLILKSV
jgi:hypothetical protein